MNNIALNRMTTLCTFGASCMAQLAYETECSWWCVAISQKILAESAPKSSSSACRASICKQNILLNGFQGKRQKPWYQYLSFSRSILFVWIAMIKSKARCDICHKHHKQRFGKLLLRCQLVKKKRGELEHHQWNSGQLTQRKNLSGSLWLPSPMVGWQGFYLHSTRVKFHWVDVPIV